MPAFIKAEGCLVRASDIQEIHHSSTDGGIIGIKTGVENKTVHGHVVARLIGSTDPVESLTEESPSELAVRLAPLISTLSASSDHWLIEYSHHVQDWAATRMTG